MTKINPKSLKNLVHWQEGQSGNPEGRPPAKEPMQRVNIYLPKRLLDAIDQKGNRSAFIREALEEKLECQDG